MKQLIKIWNLFFLKGWVVLLNITLGILGICEEELLAMGFEDILRFFKDPLKKKFPTGRNLFKKSFSYNVDDRLLKRL